jgi:hypothetical protein
MFDSDELRNQLKMARNDHETVVGVGVDTLAAILDELDRLRRTNDGGYSRLFQLPDYRSPQMADCLMLAAGYLSVGFPSCAKAVLDAHRLLCGPVEAVPGSLAAAIIDAIGDAP